MYREEGHGHNLKIPKVSQRRYVIIREILFITSTKPHSVTVLCTGNCESTTMTSSRLICVLVATQRWECMSQLPPHRFTVAKSGIT